MRTETVHPWRWRSRYVGGAAGPYAPSDPLCWVLSVELILSRLTDRERAHLADFDSGAPWTDARRAAVRKLAGEIKRRGLEPEAWEEMDGEDGWSRSDVREFLESGGRPDPDDWMLRAARALAGV